MYVKKQTDRDPYQIIFTDKEIKEAFRNPVSYELFRQALMSLLLEICFKSKKSFYI